jgi:hypothetical protein
MNKVIFSPVVVASEKNLQTWEQYLNDFSVCYRLTEFLSEDAGRRARARALLVDPNEPPRDAAVGWNGLGAYKSMLVLSLGRNPTQEQLDEVSEQYVDRFKTAVKRYEEGRANLLAMSQWLVQSVLPENLLPIFGEYAYDDIYNRSRAIKLRFRTSNKHGVITSVTRLLEVKMTKETVAGAHSFVDEVRALMRRLRSHLTDGGLNLVDVVETMILVRGLPKGGGWSVLSMAMSTDETLTAAQIVERILQQAERLTSDKALKGGESAPVTGGDSTKGIAKAVSFIDGKPQQFPNSPTNKVVGNDPRAGVQWMGQQARTTYQPYNNGNNHNYTNQPHTNQRGGGGRGGNGHKVVP